MDLLLELEIADDRLTGVVDTRALSVDIVVPTGNGAASGTLGNERVWATWTVPSNYESGRIVENVDVALDARIGEAALRLTAACRLRPQTAFFRDARVEGFVGDNAVMIEVHPSQAWSTGAVHAAGRVGTDVVTLDAEVASDLTGAVATGTIGTEDLTIRITRDWIRGARGGSITAAGGCDPNVALLIACVLLHFL